MAIDAHAEEFAGYPIRDYDPRVGVVAPEMGRREFQLTEGNSKKFWAIELAGLRHTVQFGRIGTAGQTQSKDFGSDQEARKAYEKLVAEKVKKGYTEVTAAGAPASGAKAGSKKAAGAVVPVAYRLAINWDDYEEGARMTNRLEAFVHDPSAGMVPALVIGAWDFESSSDSSDIVEALVAARDRLPALRALFLGDITYEEQEISWIQQSDVSPLFQAYPRLEHFRVRGGTGLSLGTIRHQKLKALVVEAGGLGRSVVREVGAATLPELEHLELWLGSSGYGWDGTVEDLQPILSGKKFPKLRYLGLRDSEIADQVAAAVAGAPLLERVRVLDLSLGNLSDAGAEALLASPAVARLEKLDVHHHFLSKQVMKRLQALGIEVDVSERKEPYDFDPDDRYIAVSE